MKEPDFEKLSLLIDDQLDKQQAYYVLKSLQHDEEKKAKFMRYHLIHQALKNDDILMASNNFADKLHERLLQEPVILAPRRNTAVEWQKTARLALAACVALVAVLVIGSVEKFMHPVSVTDSVALSDVEKEPSENLRFKEYLAGHDNVWYANQNLGEQHYARLTGSQQK